MEGLGGNTITYEGDEKYNITELQNGAAISSTVSPPIYPEEETKVLQFNIRIPFDGTLSFEHIKFQLTLFAQNDRIEETILPEKSIRELINQAIGKDNLELE